MESFQILAAKVFRFDVTQLLLFPGSDILCYATDQDSVVVKRIAEKTQKIGTVEVDAKVTALAAGRQGKVMLVGLNTGKVKMYAVTSACVSEICTLSPSSRPVLSLGWCTLKVQVLSLHLDEDSMLVKSYSSPLLSALSETHHTLHLAWTVTDHIVLFAQGMMPIADLQLAPDSEVIKIACFEDFQRLNVLSKTEKGLKMQSFDTSTLSSHTDELHFLSYLMLNISEIMRITTQNHRQLTQDWRSISHLFHLKFTSGIQSSLAAVQLSHLSVQEVLLQTIATGMANPGLTQFLKNDIHSYKALVQFDERVSVQMKNLKKGVLDGVLHLAQRWVVLGSKLRGVSRFEERYGVFGLRTDHISTLITCNCSSDATNISYICYSLLTGLEQMQSYIHNFVLWMNYRTS